MAAAVLGLLFVSALPWLIYWQGIRNFKSMPDFSGLQKLTPARRAVVLAEFKLKETPVVTPQNPYTKLLQFYRMAQEEPARQSPEARTEYLVLWVARCHALFDDQIIERHGLTWHKSGAALSLWLYNHTTPEQILAKAWTCLIKNRDFAAQHRAIIEPDVSEDQPP